MGRIKKILDFVLEHESHGEGIQVYTEDDQMVLFCSDCYITYLNLNEDKVAHINVDVEPELRKGSAHSNKVDG